MLERIEGFSGNRIGFRASGKITGEDYEKVLIPAVEAARQEHGHLRLLYQLGPEVEGFEARALWDDAKIGMSHLSAFEKIAMLTDSPPIQGAVKFFAFAMPCPVRVFKNAELEAAKSWLEEDPAGLEHELLADEEILILRPRGKLTPRDFETVAAEIQPIVKDKGALKGVLVDAPRFPGWQSLGALVSHLRFISEHQSKIKRLAVVSGSSAAKVMPKLVNQLVQADVRHFPEGESEAALAWLRGASASAAASAPPPG